MQVYKAWSVAMSRACQGETAAAAPAIVLAPVVITVRRRRSRPQRAAPSSDCPLAPRPAPSPPGASPEVTAAWLRRAVVLCLTAREAGSEGLASVLAGRLDAGIAGTLRRLRDSGQLDAAIAAAVGQAGAVARPDVPLGRIIRSAVRRYDLRPWLAALRRGW